MQRNSIDTRISSDFIAIAKKRKIKVVFEIDDDLLSLEDQKLKDGKLSILFFPKECRFNNNNKSLFKRKLKVTRQKGKLYSKLFKQ